MADRIETSSDTPPAQWQFSSRLDAPPRYSAVFADPGEQISTNAIPTNHEFVLHGGIFKPKPWATLRVFSRPSKVKQKHPIFFGGDNVTGEMKLKLGNQSISSISILVDFRSDGGSYTFLEYTYNVWDKGDGDPRLSDGAAKNNFNGKLSGDVEFSFAFPFPPTVDLSSLPSNKGKGHRGSSAVYQTPQTFLDHNITSNIEYELVLLITHGPLRPDSKLKGRIWFIPQITPDPPSDMRQMAYREGALLPGPEADPEGWLPLPPLSIRGTVQQNKIIELEYHLYLAKPLCYTRGTVIPCYLIISSADSRSLEILADSKLQYVRLARYIRYFDSPTKCVQQTLQGKKPSFLEEIDEAELAVWWIPPKDVLQEPYCKRLEGEIHLAKELAPSSNFAPLSVEYYVEAMAFPSEIFKHCESSSGLKNVTDGFETKILQSHPVTIATFNASGPPQVAYTPRQRPSLAHRKDDDGGIGFNRISGAKYGLGHSATLGI
uniref:Arrestin-like N-terminal domain-containing protein n=1 Tax=Psilocybe cubensis TaxID=181762 RepID=A0A8H7XXL4_PSICU